MILSDYISGTISVAADDLTVTGVGTAWLVAGFREGDLLYANGYVGLIASVESDTSLTLAAPWRGGALAGAPYRLRFMSDGERVTAQARALIEMLGNGNVEALAELAGNVNLIPIFTGPGAMSVINKSELIDGVKANVVVPNLAGRDAYDNEITGFTVQVANIGDGRAALYVKNSAAAGDWSAASFITGPVGPLPIVQAGDTVTGAPGTLANVISTPITGGVELEFTIPAGEGFKSKGAYSGATAYDKGDVVLQDRSSWIAKQATTGNAPPTLPTTSNTYWELIAARGEDGLGTITELIEGSNVTIDATDPTKPIISAAGDVVGPAASVDGRVSLFNGVTGKLLRDSGWSIGSLLGRANHTGVQPVSTLSDGGILSGLRNKLINGDQSIWQRGTGPFTSGYTSDRWFLASSGTSPSVSRIAANPGIGIPGEPLVAARIVVTAGTLASHYALFQQRIEDVTVHAGKKITVPFYMNVNANRTIGVEVRQNFGSGGSTAVSAYQHVALTPGYKRYNVVLDIPAITGKTIGANSQLILTFWFDAGDDMIPFVGSLGHQSGTYDLSVCALVAGDATNDENPFAFRHPQQEVALCQRYYELVQGSFNSGGATTAALVIPFSVLKRAIPTVTRTGNVITGSEAGTTVSGISTARFIASNVGATAAGGVFTADAEL